MTVTRAPAPEVGSSANSYEILAKLAMGGMAEIFLARGVSSAGVERYVVLKRILRNRATDTHFVRMFLDEARLAAQLQHPNIAQVYDIGKLGDSFFFTMEYVHGETVRSLLARSHALKRPIPISSVLSIIAGSAAGLQHAHERKGTDGKHLGIVHRDVSPSNLMISYEGTVKVVDFGVAKAAHRSHETQTGTVKGKISYMSPEQCKGIEIDRRSDLFSLGIVMWEMLTTERLFRRNSDFDNMHAIVTEVVPPPSRLRPDIPRDVDQIVMRLLSKSMTDRYQNADELHEAVEVVAVRTGSALSPASLGRYIRELFGQRPEPWIEMASHESHPEAYTVTSEPIPGELAISPDESVGRRLDAMPQIPLRAEHAENPPNPPGIPGALTRPVRVQAEPDLARTLQLPPDAARTLQRPKNLLELYQTFRQFPADAAPTEPMPVTVPPSGANYSVSQSNLGYIQAQLPPAQKRSHLLIVIPAVVLGIIIGIAVGFGGGAEKKTDKAVAPEATKPPTEPKLLPMGVTTAPSPAEPKPDPTPTPPETPTVPADTPTVPPNTPNATADMTETKPVTKSPKPVVKKPSVAELYDAHRYADVVAACSATSKTLESNTTTCVVAACKAHDSAKAKRWFASVTGAKRSPIIKDCAGVLPADPARSRGEGSDCKRDPMACQH